MAVALVVSSRGFGGLIAALFLGLGLGLGFWSTGAPAALAFNPACEERNKALDIDLITANPNRPGATDQARQPIRLTIPYAYLPVPGDYYGGKTVSLILRANWPELGPACLDLSEFPENMEADPFLLMQQRFQSLITLQVARMAGPGLDAELATQRQRAPFDHGLSDDGGLRVYRTVSREPAVDGGRAPGMTPFGAMPMMQDLELLIPVDPLSTNLVWMTCLRLPIPGAPNQCQARIQVGDEVQAEISFNRDLLGSWEEACDKTAALITRFIDNAKSEPL
ncbi:MAG: hypothetical protein AAF556_05710 [Pseudomonadota bacterium]